MTVTASDPLPSRLHAWWRWLSQLDSAPQASRRGRVLLISYQFPPTGGSGVQRPAKLAKYLPVSGWSVEVLTAAHSRFPWTDPSLLADLPSNLAIHRVPGREPACVARWLADRCEVFGGQALSRRVEEGLHWRLTGWADRLGMEGGESLWVGPATRAAIRRHRETPFDAVISTGPPHFVHRVAMSVAQTTGVTWLADLRDPLVSDFERCNGPARHARRMREFESSILNQADAIITTCRSFALDLRERYPNRAGRIHAITNGFDREDILHALNNASLEPKSRECLLVAAGAFYGRRELDRIIRPLHQLVQMHPHWQGRVRLAIAGTVDAEQRQALQRSAPPCVTLLGYLDHAEAIRLAARAACTLLVVPACEHGQMSIPGKTFELLALPTHVLALVPPGSDTEQIVRRVGGCTVAPFEREHAVASALRAIIESNLEGQPALNREWDQLDAFDRKAIAQRFSDVLAAAQGKTSVTRSADLPNQTGPLAVEVA